MQGPGLIRRIGVLAWVSQFPADLHDCLVVIFCFKAKQERDRRLLSGFQFRSWNQGRLRIPRILANSPDSSPADGSGLLDGSGLETASSNAFVNPITSG